MTQFSAPTGETDYWEQPLDGKVGCFFHVVGGGPNGEGQIEFRTNVDPHDWFTVGFEFIAGKSFKWFVNGKQIPDINGNLVVPAAKVPNYPQHVVLQLEGNGTPKAETNVQYDWFCAAKPVAA